MAILHATYSFGLTVYEMWSSSPILPFEPHTTSIYLLLGLYLCPVVQRDGQSLEATSFSRKARRTLKGSHCDGWSRYRMDIQNRSNCGWLS